MSQPICRRTREELPVLAICYDFDKTLSPDNMQAQGYIQDVGYDVERFWAESDALARDNGMDSNLAYMFKMVEEAEGNLVLTRSALENYGARVELYPGVEEWFERIRAFGKEHGVKVEHYILSSGLKEMIEGTSIAKAGAFEAIFASSFYFNHRGTAKWPAQAINYTSKTQFLKKKKKGVLDVNDHGVNEFFPKDKIRVPFRNMVYLGDSDTDIPCMKLVNTYGGHSIGVYDPASGREKVQRLLRENRVRYIAPADYREGQPLDSLLKAIICKTSANELLERQHERDLAEALAASETDRQYEPSR